VFSVTVFTALLGSGFQRRTFPFLWVPELSPASATKLLQLSTDCLQTLSRLTLTPRLRPAHTNLLLCKLPSQDSSQLSEIFRVRVTLRLAVYSQSVLAPNPSRFTTSFFFQVNPCGHIPYVTFSLTREWACLLGFASPLSSVRIAYIACYWKFFLLYYTQVLCQPKLCKADHV
jgi:hypothetical protein